MSGKLELTAEAKTVFDYVWRIIFENKCAGCMQEMDKSFVYNGLTVSDSELIAYSRAHVKSDASGGADSVYNLVAMHQFCNCMHQKLSITPEVMSAFYTNYTTWEELNEKRTFCEKIYREFLLAINGKLTPAGHVLDALKVFSHYILTTNNNLTRKVSEKRRRFVSTLAA